MGVVITPQSEIDKYFESDALSQSSLKKLLTGIDSFINNQKEESELFYTEKGHFVIGSAVDMLLTGEKEEFDNHYYVSQITKKPSEVEMSIINEVFSNLTEEDKDIFNLPITSLSDYKSNIENASISNDWYGGKPGDKRIEGLIERGSQYFEDLKKGLGKQILTSEEKKLIDDMERLEAFVEKFIEAIFLKKYEVCDWKR
jgi:hypothetical protein